MTKARQRFLGTLILGLVPVLAMAGGSPMSAGQAGAQQMKSGFNNINQTATQAEHDAGVSNLNISGAIGNGNDQATGQFTAQGHIMCTSGATSYVGGIGIKVTSCNATNNQVASAGIALCTSLRNNGTPCTSSSYTTTGTATPGTPLALGQDTLTLTCSGLDCGVNLQINDSLSASGPNLGTQATQAVQALGSSGIVSQLSTTINGQALANAMANEASTGSCFNNQMGSLTNSGDISNCAGTYTLQMTNPAGAQCQAGGATHWQQSCTVGVPVSTSSCHTTLDCHFTQQTTNVSCTTGQVTQLIFQEGQSCPYSQGVWCASQMQSWWNTVVSNMWNYHDLYMYVNGSFATKWNFEPNAYAYCNYAGLNCTTTTTCGTNQLGNYACNNTTTCQYNFGRGTTVSFCGTQNCSSIYTTTSSEGIVSYICSNTGTNACPAGFTESTSGSTTICTENISVPDTCTYVGTQSVTVSGATSAYEKVWNCNTCGAYQSVSP